MPFYEYICETCEHQFEAFQKISDEPIRDCPECGKTVRKKIFAPMVHLKGSGFYETEYGRSRHNHPDQKSGDGASSSSTGDSTGGSTSGSETKSETKSEAKPEKKAEAPKAEAPKAAPKAGDKAA